MYSICNAYLTKTTRLMNGQDPLPKFVHMTRNKLLLYLYNNLMVCKFKIMPNIWRIWREHKYKQMDEVINRCKEQMNELRSAIMKQVKYRPPFHLFTSCLPYFGQFTGIFT